MQETNKEMDFSQPIVHDHISILQTFGNDVSFDFLGLQIRIILDFCVNCF